LYAHFISPSQRQALQIALATAIRLPAQRPAVQPHAERAKRAEHSRLKRGLARSFGLEKMTLQVRPVFLRRASMADRRSDSEPIRVSFFKPSTADGCRIPSRR